MTDRENNAPLTVPEINALIARIRTEVATAVVGMDNAIEAVQRGDLAEVRALVRNGADIYQPLPSGRSLLALAVEYDRHAVAEFLRGWGVE